MKFNIPELITNYFYLKPDINNPLERVKFGTSGHRGSANKKTFNEEHILAISQSIAEYKKDNNITGPIFIGKDTHALSEPAEKTAIKVLVANDIEVILNNTYTPTPVISHTIIEHNKKNNNLSDGIVITPSHNPPDDGGFKYNSTNAGASDTHITKKIEEKANKILKERTYKKIELEDALKKIKTDDFITPYVKDLEKVVDMDLIKKSKLKIAADPLGGSAIPVYEKINEIWNTNFDIKDNEVDFTFSFMPPDKDGKIRMDCSSPYAMANLLKLKDKYDLAFANDTDSDRHGIVTPKGGLINPNHYLSVAVWYLFQNRDFKGLKIGKSVVTTSMIDRIAKYLDIEVYETPVGFKYFAEGLYEGWLGFACEESAGASFLRFDKSAFSTDKDGIIMNMLAIEITEKTQKDIADIYKELENKFGKCFYKRVDIPTTPEIKEKIKTLTHLPIKELAGEKIEKIYSRAPGNNESIGGLKIVTKNAWAAFRPSGTEDIYKIYAESFISQEHLEKIIQEIQDIILKELK